MIGFENPQTSAYYESIGRVNLYDLGKVVCPEDLPKYLEGFTKENVLREIQENGAFKLHYRLMLEREPSPLTPACSVHEIGIFVCTQYPDAVLRPCAEAEYVTYIFPPYYYHQEDFYSVFHFTDPLRLQTVGILSEGSAHHWVGEYQ